MHLYFLAALCANKTLNVRMVMIIRTNGRVCGARYTDERPYIVPILYGRRVLKCCFMFRVLHCMIVVHMLTVIFILNRRKQHVYVQQRE